MVGRVTLIRYFFLGLKEILDVELQGKLSIIYSLHRLHFTCFITSNSLIISSIKSVASFLYETAALIASLNN